MTIAPNWLLRLAGHDRGRERNLAEASRGAERREQEEAIARDETRFSARMGELGGAAHVALGTSSTGAPYRIAVDDLVSLPSWVTGGTGSGKSRFVGAFVERLLDALIAGAPVSIIAVDGKGETVDHLLRSVAARAERMPRNAHASLLSRVHTLRFFGREYLPSWPLLAAVPGVPIATQADAVAEVLAEIAADATFGPRQRSTLAAILALAIEFKVPAVGLPWLLAAPDEVASLAARSSLPGVRLDLSRFEREPQGSVDGLIARLGTLLRVPSIKAVLSGEESFDFQPSFEPGNITTLGFDGAELGVRSAVRALGSLAISGFANAAFDPRRSVRGKTIILLDEPQIFLTSVSLSQLERLVTLGRSFGAGGVVFVHQGATQLPQEFQAILNTNVVLRVLGRSSEHDAAAAGEWLPVTGRVPRRREPGVRPSGQTRFMSEGEERRFRVAEIGRLPARHFLVADRRTRGAFSPRVVVAPDYDPPPWSAIDPGVTDAVRRGSVGVPRAVLEERVRVIEEETAARFDEAQRAGGAGRRRGRSIKTPDVVGRGGDDRRGGVP